MQYRLQPCGLTQKLSFFRRSPPSICGCGSRCESATGLGRFWQDLHCRAALELVDDVGVERICSGLLGFEPLEKEPTVNGPRLRRLSLATRCCAGYAPRQSTLRCQSSANKVKVEAGSSLSKLPSAMRTLICRCPSRTMME